MFLINRYLRHKQNEIKYNEVNNMIEKLNNEIKKMPCKTWKKNTIERKKCEIKKKKNKKKKNKKN